MSAERTAARDDTLLHDRLFIGGEWVAPRSGRLIESIDPATEEVWARVAEADARDVDDAVAAARNALSGPWSKFEPSKRGALIHRLGSLLAMLREAARRGSGPRPKELLAAESRPRASIPSVQVAWRRAHVQRPGRLAPSSPRSASSGRGALVLDRKPCGI